MADSGFIMLSNNSKKEEMLRKIDSAKKRKANVPWPIPDTENPNLFLRLHGEILSFTTFVSPTEVEVNNRSNFLSDMENIVEEIWSSRYPEARIEVFGSTRTQMYLPNSDMDMVVFGVPEMSNTAMYELSDYLQDYNLVSALEVIDKARIPIVKFTHKESGIQCDVSFNVAGGLETANLVTALMPHYPAFRPLVLVLKYFLAQRKLNETYNGGIGSFLLQLMVMSFLQHHNHQREMHYYPENMYNLGHLLLGFFKLYGDRFNYADITISLRNDGVYLLKRSKGWLNPNRSFLLSIENPIEPKLDVGKNSYDIRRIKRTFEYAYGVLRAEMNLAENNKDVKSILSSVINVDFTLQHRVGPSVEGYAPLQDASTAIPQFHIGTHSKKKKKKKKSNAPSSSSMASTTFSPQNYTTIRQQMPQNKKQKLSNTPASNKREHQKDFVPFSGSGNQLGFHMGTNEKPKKVKSRYPTREERAEFREIQREEKLLRKQQNKLHYGIKQRKKAKKKANKKQNNADSYGSKSRPIKLD